MLLHDWIFIFVCLYFKILNISCDEGSTLAFAIDDTRSMWDDIDQVRKEAKEIMNVVLTEKSSEIKEYVLVTINDPDVVLRTKTASSVTFQNYLNQIRVHNYGNDDCEEMSLTGIQKALEASKPGSYIYVFTDASAKDYHKVEKVKSLCEKKQSQVVFVLTGDCGSAQDPKYMVYHDIAAASSGQVFRVRKDQVHTVLETIKILIRGRHTPLKWLTVPKTNQFVPIEFSIDEKADYAIVSTSGTNVGLHVTSTRDQYGPQPKTERIMWNDNGKVVKVNNLKPGTYYAWVKGQSTTSVVIYARTDFTFEHGFSALKPSSIKDTSKQPIAGKNQHLAIKVSDPENSVDIKSVKILDMNENVLEDMPLKKNGDFYITDAFVAPTKMFKIAVNGIIKTTGKPITRISKTAIEPQPPPSAPETVPDVQTDKEVKTIDFGSDLSLTCDVSANPEPVIEWFTEDGTRLQSESSEIEVPKYISYLKLKNVQKDEIYVCKATNRKGSTQSQTKVTVKPAFTKIPTTPGSTTAEYAKDVKIQCEIESYLPITIKWFHSGKELYNSPMYAISGDGMELTLKSVDIGMDGKYTCEASLNSNPSVKKTHNTVVTIAGLARPVIDTSNKGPQIMTGDQVQLSCKTVQGHPKPQVKWFKKNGESLELLSGETNEILTVRSADVSDASKYKCTVENQLGSDSAEFEVIPETKPVAQIDEGAKLLVNYAAPVSLTCRISARPTPKIEWFTSDGTLLPSESSVLEIPSYISYLNVTSATQNETYICKATNTRGSTTSTTEVNVRPPFKPTIPSLPSTVSKNAQHADDVKIQCNIESYLPITIRWFHAGEEIFNTPEHAISGDGAELTLKSIDVGMEGKYTCEASLQSDPSVKEAHNTVVTIAGLARPVIETQNNRTKVMTGDQVKLSCKTVQGHPKPQVKWFKKNGERLELLSGETNEILTVRSADVSDVSKYKCIVQNKLGSDSAEFEVIPETKPIAQIDEGAKLLVNYGAPVSLTCRISARPTPKIEWFTSDGTLLPSKSSVLEIPSYISYLNVTSATQNETYICRATNTRGSTTSTTEVNVRPPFKPTIPSLPSTVSKNAQHADDVKIQCNIESYLPITIRWFHAGEEIVNTPEHAISGDGAELTLKSIDVGMEGKYTCEASLQSDPSVKEAHNTVVTIAGLARPVIETTNDRTKVMTGDQVKLSCKTVQGHPKPQVKWFKKNGERLELLSGETNEILTVRSADVTDASKYKCTVENKLGSDSAEFEVIPETIPVVQNDQGDKLNASYGSQVSLTCRVTARPAPEIEWLTSDGTVLPSQSSVIEVPTYKSILKVPNIQKTETYYCKATNKKGSATSKTEVTVPPVFVNITKPSGPTNADYGKDLKIQCNIESYLPITIKWFHSGKELYNSPMYAISGDGMELTLKSVDIGMDGKYTCEASLNSNPSVKKTIITVVTISGLVPPVIAPTNKKIQVMKTESVQLNCKTVQGKPKAKVTWYKKNGDRFELLSGETNEVLTIPKAYLTNSGRYKCIAGNVKGNDSAEFEVTVSSSPEVTIAETQKSFAYGSNAEFTCEVESHSFPAIAWMDAKGKLLENKVTQTSEYHYVNKLKLENVKNTAAYVCVATNNIGYNSEFVNVTVASPFIVQEHIDDKDYTRIYYGKDKNLRCDINSSQEIKIIWFKQNIGLKSSRQAITSNSKYDISKDGTQLKIKSMDTTEVGKYTCEASLVSNPEEKVSYSTNVKILGVTLPEISYSTTVLYGRNFTAICRVKGVPKPTISWQFQPKGSEKFHLISGSQEEYNIPEITLMDAGVYKCVAKNAIGKTEQDYNVVVQEPPTITNVKNVFVGVEGDAVLMVPCNVTGFPDPVIVWKKDGSIINKGTKYDIKGHILHINNPQMKQDTGNVTCEATNKLGTAEQTFETYVSDNFDIEDEFNGDTHYINVDERKATTTKIVCGMVADSNAKSVRWFRNAVRMNQTGSSYSIDRPTVSDDGNYTCRVNTEEGPKSENFVVNVGHAPNFENDSPSPNTVDWHNDEVLDCSENSKPKAKIEWKHNGIIIKSLKDRQEIDVTDWGQYVCTVSNVHGTISRTFDVMSSGCYLREFMGTENMPLISQVTTPEMPNPISNSDLEVKQNDKIKFSCPNSIKSANSFQMLPGKTEVVAECATQDKFVINGKIYKYQDLQCKTKVEPSVVKTNEQCAGPNTEMLRVGFAVNGFLEAYRVCYDKSINAPMFARSKISPTKSGIGVEASMFRWSFISDVSDGKLTGGFTCGKSSKCCYEKGQLVNVNELPFSPAQGATFKNNINSIAVWNPCNDQRRTSWRKFENELREMSSMFDSWSTWTGASNYVNKNGGLVPRYLWKVMNYDGESSVMVYVNDASPVASDIKCTKPCESMMEAAGKFLYCCTLDEFSKVFGIPTKQFQEP